MIIRDLQKQPWPYPKPCPAVMPPRHVKKKAEEPRPRSFDPPKLAVVLVDVVKTKIHDKSVGYPGGTVPEGIERLCGLLRMAEKLGIPIFLIRPDNDWVLGQKGSTEIAPGVLRSAPSARIISKSYENSFTRTSLSRQLDGLGVNTLVIGGWDLQKCVRKTIIEGALAPRRNYRVITSEEICFADTLYTAWIARYEKTKVSSEIPVGYAHLESMRRHYERTLDLFRKHPMVEYYEEFDSLMAAVEKTVLGIHDSKHRWLC